MELKLSVSIGATLQVKNAKGEWDWIKPEVGAEVLLNQHDLKQGGDDNSMLQGVFTQLWDEVVGPQFSAVVLDLIADQTPAVEAEKESDEATESEENENKTTDEDEYY